MNRRSLVVVAAVLIVAVVGVYGTVQFLDYQARLAGPSEVATIDGLAPAGEEGSVMFRNTASGAGYGHLATVPLGDQGGARTVDSVTCDRIDATPTDRLCLSIDRGVVTTFTATLYDADGVEQSSWPLPGVPSRTRFSPDGRLVAFSAFITGESYATVGFSIATRIESVDGGGVSVDLEEFAFSVGGERVTSADRNFWGVSFATDSTAFYATAASAGRTWLVRGDIEQRTLSAVRENAECPSVSPDGSRVAYKTRPAGAAPGHWAAAVLDLATGVETVLPETRSVDDQVEWLDDDTVLYGLPRENAAGDSDIWMLPVTGTGAPTLAIEHAWSPSVVRAEASPGAERERG